ncbi:hypothetical protein OH77DRAFT_1314205 [Trametes cingulata]|nr:hypothetical protein OH77DRAFT_1314205 [Trametes cingulata]
MSSDGPPWDFRDPHTGEIRLLGVPERLQSHPDLRQRGLVVTHPLKPGFVYATSHRQQPQYAVKILDLATEELAIYQRLLELDPASPNHTLPCQVTQLGHPLLIMPRLLEVYAMFGTAQWTLYELLSVFLQIVEGVEFLHRLHIAHLDLCFDNVVGAGATEAQYHRGVVHGKVYIIDFGSARTLQLGPGKQRAIVLPPTQIRPPNGLKHFDPYSWDVFCVAHILQVLVEFEGSDDSKWITHRYIRWLMGSERGCTGICRCRPTARKARQVLAFIRTVVYVLDLCKWSVSG